MNDENYIQIKKCYDKIEDSCYRMGISVDEYYNLISKQKETIEEHFIKKSELENKIQQFDFDWGD
jgi:UTP-glucose-1-phosphate uridylyltransferase